MYYIILIKWDGVQTLKPHGIETLFVLQYSIVRFSSYKEVEHYSGTWHTHRRDSTIILLFISLYFFLYLSVGYLMWKLHVPSLHLGLIFIVICDSQGNLRIYMYIIVTLVVCEILYLQSL